MHGGGAEVPSTSGSNNATSTIQTSMPSSDIVGLVNGDALMMFPLSAPVSVARFFIAGSVVGSFTSLHFSARACWMDLLLSKHSTSNPHADEASSSGSSSSSSSSSRFTFRQQLCEIGFFLAVTVGPALFLKELDMVLDLVGSMAVIPFMFVFPGALQVKMDGDGEHDKAIGYCMIGFGIIMAITGLSVTISQQLMAAN
jgi:hypothetical protein